jgi:type IV pilus assembly protein PilM
MQLPFFNTRAKRRDEIVAIDLGGRHTKAVHVQHKGGQLRLVGYTIQDAPSDQNTFSVDVLAEHLKTVSRALGETTKSVVVSVSVNDSVLKRIEMPPMPMEDMRQMLKFNTKNYLQQDLPDHVFDCSVVLPRPNGETKENAKSTLGQKQRLIVGGGRRQFINDVASAARQAGLTATEVVPGLIGPVNAFERSEPEVFANEAVALVDLGFRNTTIAMLQQGEFIMHRVINMGGDRITAGLAEALGISYVEAEGIKIGMAMEVQSSIDPIVTTLGRELRAFIDFYEHQQDVAVSQVFVSGGSARGELLMESLQTELMLPCRVWDPAKAVRAMLPPEQTEDLPNFAPQLAVALGAAISAL